MSEIPAESKSDHQPEFDGEDRATVLVVSPEEAHSRLDSLLVKRFPDFSRAKIQRAVAQGGALVDGAKAKSSLRIKSGQTIRFEVPEAWSDDQIPEDIPLDIVYQDDSIIAVNKPPGMVVHPAKGHWSGTLTAALAFHFQQLSSVGGSTRPGIVHRLDRDTSGIMLVAKNDEAHKSLAKQFETRTIEKQYWALVSPAPDRDRDLIDQPIGAHPYQREKKTIRAGHATSREAQTFFEVVERFKGFGVLCVKPKTGRTHQIRVHMAHAGSPVLCDRLYSGRARISKTDLIHRTTSGSDSDSLLLERQALHAHRIGFEHPVSGERMELVAELPDDLQRTLDMIRETRPL